ncbi:MAG TPA: DUF1801 domain-containing protein [Ignavibacteria bacterium]|nr:DUF1801 domain-containing protein [Ignavibacteria bacterium]
MKKVLNTKNIKDIDTYLLLQPEPIRAVLEKLRKTIRSAAPEAEELISYHIPAYRYHGMLVYFAAFKNHCSFFPGGIVESMKDELKDYKTSKGTIQFTIDNPLPDSLVRKIVKARMKQNILKGKMKIKIK